MLKNENVQLFSVVYYGEQNKSLCLCEKYQNVPVPTFRQK